MRLALLEIAAIATGVAGCRVSSGTAAEGPDAAAPTTETSGALIVDWTINGAADPNRCSTSAAVVQVSVFDSASKQVGRLQESCSAFATTFSLEQGVYTAEALLIDTAGRLSTKPVRIDDIAINARSQYTAPIDFAIVAR
jgi:hypothetical protein